jgi:hypothetical protein
MAHTTRPEGALPPRGRPRSFDLDQVIDAAMLLFWKDGYEDTNLAERVLVHRHHGQVRQR